mgnify:CR=1 FL=1
MVLGIQLRQDRFFYSTSVVFENQFRPSNNSYVNMITMQKLMSLIRRATYKIYNHTSTSKVGL